MHERCRKKIIVKENMLDCFFLSLSAFLVFIPSLPCPMHTCCVSIFAVETVAMDNWVGWFAAVDTWLLISHASAELSPIDLLVSIIDSILFSSDGPAKNETNSQLKLKLINYN